MMITNAGCRVCGNKKLQRFLKLGPQPLANSFIKIKYQRARSKEPFFPLDVYFCSECGLLQLKDVVKPEVMFRHYLYVSSTSPVLVAHFRRMAQSLIQRFKLGKKDLVVDVGANDGTLLKPFKKAGIRVLGVDPAENIAEQTTASGIKVVPEFFTAKLAKKLKRQYGLARIITGTNVFAHINDIADVIEGVRAWLKPKGILVIEVPYLVDFFKKNLFDTVYHEHLSYFGVRPLVRFFADQGMEVFDVKRVKAQGGSIRVFVKKAEAKRQVKPAVKRLMELEENMKLNKLVTWKKFADRVKQNKIKLNQLLKRLKQQNRRIVGYGAAAKGNTLLNYFGIDKRSLDYIVDDSPLKQGYLTPGTHIPVMVPEKLYQDIPDYVLILAWNFAASIMKRRASFAKLGGKFIIPVPDPKVV